MPLGRIRKIEKGGEVAGVPVRKLRLSMTSQHNDERSNMGFICHDVVSILCSFHSH